MVGVGHFEFQEAVSHLRRTVRQAIRDIGLDGRRELRRGDVKLTLSGIKENAWDLMISPGD